MTYSHLRTIFFNDLSAGFWNSNISQEPSEVFINPNVTDKKLLKCWIFVEVNKSKHKQIFSIKRKKVYLSSGLQY